MAKANISVSLDTMKLARLDQLIEGEDSPYDNRTEAIGEAVGMLLAAEDALENDVE